MSAWRHSGWAVAWRSLHAQPSRLWTAAAQGELGWDLDDVVLFRGSSDPGRLTSARSDDDSVSLCIESPTHTRNVQANRSRVVVRDRGMNRTIWKMDPKWAFAESDRGWEAHWSGIKLTARFPDTPSVRMVQESGQPQFHFDAGPGISRSIFEVSTGNTPRISTAIGAGTFPGMGHV
jgi:hypothetical protein